jgi:hypothetical protein
MGEHGATLSRSGLPRECDPVCVGPRPCYSAAPAVGTIHP